MKLTVPILCYIIKKNKLKKEKINKLFYRKCDYIRFFTFKNKK